MKLVAISQDAADLLDKETSSSNIGREDSVEHGFPGPRQWSRPRRALQGSRCESFTVLPRHVFPSEKAH